MQDQAAIEALDRIDRALRDRPEAPGSPGLLDGACGTALFYAYYYRRSGDDAHLEIVYRGVERLIAALAHERQRVSHCSGIAGIAWCVHHLVRLDLVDIGDSEDAFFEEVDAVLCDAILGDLQRGRRDFLHDGLGAVVYLVGRLPAPHVASCLARVIDELARTSTTDAQGTRWADHMSGTELAPSTPAYNLGLAHGVPGILSLVSLVYEAGIAADRAASMLRDGARWLRAQRRDTTAELVSLYPCVVDGAGNAVGAPDSRLGWCYGDLGVATALTNLGMRLGDRALIDEAHAILRHTMHHRTPENGQVDDASLCHGSLGISHIYRRASLATGDATFRAAAEQWLAHGLGLGTHADGVAGFKARTLDGFASHAHLLQGAAGIGLALLAALDPAHGSAWDRCLLIS